MNRVVFYLFVFFINYQFYAQENQPAVITIKDSILEANFDNGGQLKVYTSANDTTGTVIKYEPCKDNIVQIPSSEIIYQQNCEDNKVRLWVDGHEDKAIDIYYCDKNDLFYSVKSMFSNSCLDKEEVKTSKYERITEIPTPAFFVTHSEESGISRDNENRVLLIDATSSPFNNFNSVLVNHEKEEVKALDMHGNITIFLKQFNASNIKEFTVSVNETEYTYKNDFELTQQPHPVEDSSKFQKEFQREKNKLEDQDSNYLKGFYEYLESINSLASNEIEQLQIFKIKLRQTVNENNIELSNTAKEYYNAILSWSPTWINLTPLPLAVPDTDEVIIEISATGDEGTEIIAPTRVSKYRVKGGLVFDLGGKFYLTGLKNNDVYTETVEVDGEEQRLARMDEDNQTSIGYGINAEMALRTGSAFRPTLNLGTFVPLEEEISPYLAVGPGLNIQANRVKFSILGGLAFGSVNDINERYKGKDLSEGDLVEIELAQKVWKRSWFLGVGIRYNLSGNEEE